MKGYFLVQFWYLLNLALNKIVKTTCKTIFLPVFQIRYTNKTIQLSKGHSLCS